jgi:nucleotide-binding universal stress UspA family protein
MFRSILCPVDFSQHSRDALRYAVAVAQRFGGRVTAVFVNDPLLLAAAGNFSGGRRKFVQQARIELERFVKRSVAAVSPVDPDVALVLASGNPADEILTTAARLGSDLIVIGTEGLSGFQKLFFGSTTEQVLRRVAIPALAIPPSRGRRSRGGRPRPIKRVLAPLDLAGEWQSDAIRAATVAAAFDAELVLVHVLSKIQTPPWLRLAGAHHPRRVVKARRALDRVRRKLAPDLRITSHVLEGNPAHEIARLTTGAPSLVVMSLRGGAGVFGARRGAIAYHVLTHSATPVLALPRRRLGGPFSTRLAKALTGGLSERDRVEVAGIDALISVAATKDRTPR